jgi:hypothetical protein
MSDLRPHFPNAARPLAVVAGCALLSACVGNPFSDARIDPASTVAPDVARLTREDVKFPTFASIPNPPKDVRPVAEYGRRADAVVAAGEAVTQATAPGTWTLDGTDAFAEKARRDAGPQLEPPTSSDAEAFARELRERATPPPPR